MTVTEMTVTEVTVTPYLHRICHVKEHIQRAIHSDGLNCYPCLAVALRVRHSSASAQHW
jgi:hypothetical protein